MRASATSVTSPRRRCWNRCGAQGLMEVEGLPQEFDVVCLGGGGAGEAIANGLEGSGISLAVVERELGGGEGPYWGCLPSKTPLRSRETLEEGDRPPPLAPSPLEWDRHLS